MVRYISSVCLLSIACGVSPDKTPAKKTSHDSTPTEDTATTSPESTTDTAEPTNTDSPQPPACDQTQFGNESAFAQPAGVGQLTQLTGWSDEDLCGDNHYDTAYGTADIDGDGQLDLVITRDDCGDPQVGKSHWVVHLGTGTGFGSAQQLPLPPIGPLHQLAGFSEEAVCGNDNAYDLAFGTTDVNGDGRADIVVTRDDCGDPSTGTTHWVVYPGTGSGFGAPSTLTLPEVGPLTQLAGWSDEDRCGDNNKYDMAYGTVDINGDGLLDLVITRDDCGDPDVGTTHWVVHLGTGTGFGAARNVPLPSIGPLTQLVGFSDENVCGNNNLFDLAFGTTDVNGDGRADIVVTHDDCGDPSTGKTQWMVYPGTGAGFGAPWPLPLPDAGPMSQLTGWSDEAVCGDNNFYDLAYSTADVDGDGMLDVVITRDDCGDPGVGTTHWAVFPGTCGP